VDQTRKVISAMKKLLLVIFALVLSGCASAGSTRGGADYRPAWYKHPVTGAVQKCDCGFYPGAQWSRYSCGKARQAEGYIEVEKCASESAGPLCVTRDEVRTVEDR
jgi:hypothetical protein